MERTVTARRARGLVAACHPAPTAVVTLLAGLLVAGAGGGAGRTLLAVAAVLAGQLSIGWSNDWIDAERDILVGRQDKPVAAGAVSAGEVRAAALTAAAACVLLSLATGVLPGAVHLTIVAAGWAYNAGLKSTAVSWLPYAVAFGLLPAFLVLTGPGQPRPAGWALATGALLGTGAHFANVLPDLDDDGATGVRGLPHRLGRTVSSVLAPVLLLTAVVVVVAGPPGPRGALVWLLGSVAVLLGLGAGVVAVVRHRSRLPFALTMAVAAVCVVLLVAAGEHLAAGP